MSASPSIPHRAQTSVHPPFSEPGRSLHSGKRFRGTRHIGAVELGEQPDGEVTVRSLHRHRSVGTVGCNDAVVDLPDLIDRPQDGRIVRRNQACGALVRRTSQELEDDPGGPAILVCRWLVDQKDPG